MHFSTASQRAERQCGQPVHANYQLCNIFHGPCPSTPRTAEAEGRERRYRGRERNHVIVPCSRPNLLMKSDMLLLDQWTVLPLEDTTTPSENGMFGIVVLSIQ